MGVGYAFKCLADFLESRECLILIVTEHICTHPPPHPPQIDCILGHETIDPVMPKAELFAVIFTRM